MPTPGPNGAGEYEWPDGIYRKEKPLTKFATPSNTRQRSILAWARRTFGEVAISRPERGARMLEAAVEAAQAVGLGEIISYKIVARVYSRPVGDVANEIGALTLCVEALAEACDINAEDAAETEFARILSIPKEEFEKRHAAKVAAGTANVEVMPVVRDDKDFAIEFGGYLATAAEAFIAYPGPDEFRGLQSAIYEFRKRKDRAATSSTVWYVIIKNGAFYRPNRAGYTKHVEAAGFYTLEEATTEAEGRDEITFEPLSKYRERLEYSVEIAKEALAKIGDQS